MKQIFSFGLTAALLLACLTGCGGQADGTAPGGTAPSGVLRSGNARRPGADAACVPRPGGGTRRR